MSDDELVKTVVEAEAQVLTVPPFSEWRQFALMLSGYELAQELGFRLGEWAGLIWRAAFD